MADTVAAASIARGDRPGPRTAFSTRSWSALIADTEELLREASRVTGDDDLAAAFEGTDPDALIALLDTATHTLFGHLRSVSGEVPAPQLPELAALTEQLYGRQNELRQHGAERRLAGIASVQEGLARLHGAPTMSRLIDMAPAELCRSCGFERSVIFRVEGSELVPTGVHVMGDPAWAARLLAVSDTERLQLKHMLVETEMLRRRAPAIIHDAPNDPRTFKPLVEAWEVTSYVAAPVIYESRVIGFVHADCWFAGRAMDTIDRDLLWMFSEGFAWAIERASLMERVEGQREHVSRMLAATEEVMAEISRSGVAMIRGGERNTATATAAAAHFVAPDSRIDSLLTPREREVLALLGAGATNAAIATQLVISEGTVKSHVKHILRKLRVSNRAEAVSRYAGLMQSSP